MDRLIDSALSFGKRKLDDFATYEQNVQNLKRQMTDLERKRNDVQKRVDEARRRLEEPTEEVQGWLERAAEIIGDGRKIEEQVNENTSHGLLSNCSSRLKLSKEAEEKADEAMTHRQVDLNPVSFVPPPPVVEPVPNTGYSEDFASVKSSKKQVNDALRDENIRVIGVYGMGGAGKTALMKSVNNGLEGTQLFKKVIMVTVSSSPDVKIIQDQIADRLGLELKRNWNINKRAASLSKRLAAEKPFLIILDDVWKRFDMDEIGVVGGTEFKGCKVVLTTRKEDVCRQMDAQRYIKVESLSKEESWTLFERKAGEVVQFPTLRPIAEEIVRKCGGTPLAIITMGSLFKGVRDEVVWRDALAALKSSEPTELEGIMPAVISSIRFSFDHLPDSRIKMCFLFCCLFPEDCHIKLRDLLMYGLRGGFLHGDLAEARDKLHVHVKKLKESSLLLDGDDEDSVKVHDISRDVGISIGSRKEHRFFVKSGLRLRKWPDREDLHESKTISLMNNAFDTWPDSPDCAEVVTLLLQNNGRREIPHGFFRSMEKLVILDLSNTNMLSLHPSFTSLKNLRTLCLDECLIRDVSLVGSLEKLEILSLRNSCMQALPKEIGGLTNLKLLDISMNNNLKEIPSQVISRLSSLQELHMKGSFRNWDEEGRGNGPQASFSEVASLECLTLLDVEVWSEGIMCQDITGPWKKLKEFNISFFRTYVLHDPVPVPLCDWPLEDHFDETTKYKRKIKLIQSIFISNWVKVLLAKTEELCLVHYEDVKTFLPQHVWNMQNLACLTLEDCEGIESVVEAPMPWDAFGRLEELLLGYLTNLKQICSGPLPSGFFCNLRTLVVRSCLKITILLPYDLLQRMPKLEVLDVYRNDELQEVFHFEVPAEGHHAVLSNLRRLKLWCLSKLRAIWLGDIPLGSLCNVKELDVTGCRALRSLFSPSLRKGLQQQQQLKIVGCNRMLKLNFDDQVEMSTFPLVRPPIFQNLKELTIGHCHSLMDLLTWSLAQGLQQLETLYVWQCNELTTIIAQGEEDMKGSMFPQLGTLTLEELPRLASFCKGRVILDFPSLKLIDVGRCENLKRLPLGIQSAPDLQCIQAEKQCFQRLEWDNEERVHPDILTWRFQLLFKEWPQRNGS